MGALSSSSSLIVPHILRRRPPPFSLFKHLQTTTSLPTTATSTQFISLFSRSFSLSSSLPTPNSLSTLSSQTPISLDTQNDDQTEIDSEIETGTETEAESSQDFENPDKEEDESGNTTPVVVDPKLTSKHKELLLNLRGIDIKEKKELASYAHSLGKKLKSQSIGKSGVTDAVGIAMVENLESNELLKIKIHNNCPEELDDAVRRLEEATGSVVVSRIGRTVILYRPSLTKLIAEEKKKQAQKIFLKRRAAFHSTFQKRGGRPSGPFIRSSRDGGGGGGGRRSSGSSAVADTLRPSGRGQRGASRPR